MKFEVTRLMHLGPITNSFVFNIVCIDLKLPGINILCSLSETDGIEKTSELEFFIPMFSRTSATS